MRSYNVVMYDGKKKTCKRRTKQLHTNSTLYSTRSFVYIKCSIPHLCDEFHWKCLFLACNLCAVSRQKNIVHMKLFFASHSLVLNLIILMVNVTLSVQLQLNMKYNIYIVSTLLMQREVLSTNLIDAIS